MSLPPPPPPPLLHCPASRCDTEPGLCEHQLSSDEYATITTIVILPIIVALVTPCIARGSCFGRDDDREAAIFRSRNRRIDPPMFLGGVGLLPLDCGHSGLLTVIVILILAFVVTFYASLTSLQPCNSALGECRTISCVCGNEIPQGYVFMFCSLSITSLILVQRVSRFPHHNRPQHRTFKSLFLLGALLLTCTAVFPEMYDDDGRTSGAFGLLYSLHLLGVFGSAGLTVGVPAAWFVNHWRTHRADVPMRSLLARVVYIVAQFAFGIAFMVTSGSVHDQTNHYCSYLQTEAECNGYPLLSADQCDTLLGCIHDHTSTRVGNGSVDASCDLLIQPNFKCHWRQEQDLTPWTLLLAPSGFVDQAANCIKKDCPLFAYARGVSLEFAVLLLTLCYVTSFGLHDVQRLLDRPRGGGPGDSTPILSVTDPLRADAISKSEVSFDQP